MQAIPLLQLMHLSSSNLPVGAFTWSQGLEWAVEAGWVRDVDGFVRWQQGQLTQGLFSVDLPLLARLYQAAEQQDGDSFSRWSHYLLACRESAELRSEEISRGEAFLRLLRGWALPDLEHWAGSIGRSQTAGMAWLAVQWQIPLRDIALCIGYGWIESAVMAGLKLVPFGQQTAHRLIPQLNEQLAAGLDAALACPDDRIGAGMPLAAIASARHETQYSRLFRS